MKTATPGSQKASASQNRATKLQPGRYKIHGRIIERHHPIPGRQQTTTWCDESGKVLGYTLKEAIEIVCKQTPLEIEEPTACRMIETGAAKVTERGNENTYLIDVDGQRLFFKHTGEPEQEASITPAEQVAISCRRIFQMIADHNMDNRENLKAIARGMLNTIDELVPMARTHA